MQQIIVLLVGIGLIALVMGVRSLLRRPRLFVEARLSGTTRAGKLYIVVHNRGWRPAADVRVIASWTREEERALVDEQEVDFIEGRGALAFIVTALHRAIVRQPQDWKHIEVRVEAKNARARTVRLDVAQRQPSEGAGEEAERPPAVEYVKDVATCPQKPGEPHLFQEDRVFNDGVHERWEVCRRCQYVRKQPLTPEEEAIQQSARRERSAREQARMEAEWAYARSQAAQGRARPRHHDPPRAHREPPPPVQDDPFPPNIAFWVLGLDPARATWPDVQRAHRELAREFHPDRAPSGGDPRALALFEQRMRDVNRARDRLREHFGAPSKA